MNWDFMFDPPNDHEVCMCTECHRFGCHEVTNEWADLGCGLCEEEL